jgi:L-ribulokinase
MSERGHYAVGIDFGTESARALLVDCADGRECATSIYRYANGVLDERLPEPLAQVTLEPDWALQDPDDYLRALRHTVTKLLAQTGVAAADVVGIGIDFTSCTMLPTLADGTPLCSLGEFRSQPHAWVKLWKHHAAQPEADRINALAEAREEPWLQHYGGRISSEWFFPKALQILDEAPTVYQRADRLIEAGDWIVWRLTNVETRNSCTAGYKAMWSKRDGFPAEDYFRALDPRFARVVDDKMSRQIVPIGTRAGGLAADPAAWTGLEVGTAVSVANVDAHVSAPAAAVTAPGVLVAVMGTSTCDIALGTELRLVNGMCGVVEDGVVPGLFGYETGQPAVGDTFAWFVERFLPGTYHDRAAAEGRDVYDILNEEAATIRPGASGLLALDWWNGNRSILVDTDLRGLIVGMTVATRPPEVYRALIESTAFGMRVIIEALRKAGVPVHRVVACGGLPERNKLLMQIYADATGCIFEVAASSQTPALGSALFGAVAAGAALGGHDSIVEASRRMVQPSQERYVPNPENTRAYDLLYAEFLRLHDLFGRGGDDVMRNLKRIQLEQHPSASGRRPSRLKGDEAQRR